MGKACTEACTGPAPAAGAQERFGQRLGGMQEVLPCWQDRGVGALLLWVSMDRLYRLTLSCEPGSGRVHSSVEVRRGEVACTCARAAVVAAAHLPDAINCRCRQAHTKRPLLHAIAKWTLTVLCLLCMRRSSSRRAACPVQAICPSRAAWPTCHPARCSWRPWGATRSSGWTAASRRRCPAARLFWTRWPPTSQALGSSRHEALACLPRWTFLSCRVPKRTCTLYMACNIQLLSL
jgi:hypothetical protein